MLAARSAYLAAALILLAVVLGLYYDAKDARDSTAPVEANSASMPAAVAAPAEDPRPPATVASRPQVTHFRIGHRNVKSIYVDGAAMWVATTDGLIRYDMAREKHEFFDRKDGLDSASVFYVGRVNGHVLAGTAGGRLCVFDEGSRRWTSSAIPAAGAVLDVLETQGGEVWIASLSGVAQVPAGKIARQADWSQHLPAEPVYALAEGKQGDIWFGTERGVARLASGRWQRWDFDGEKVRVVAVKVDERGSVWAGTWGKGLRRFDGKSWKTYARAQGLPGEHVFALFDDRRGSIWIGTDRGVARLKDGRLEKPIRARDGLIADKAFALATTSDDSLWVGSFGGVARIRPAGAL